ncbi:iduronate 2-sulfatase isoform X1 [Colias croceus]|uniref:iduronate 2-sulfatase isoform X1 n=1 Tax=Colias crocea TaxID=72248 RepID=UPI001E27D11F|nr:iduronate 2-sulfatase isoform X1 [Colias croceus]
MMIFECDRFKGVIIVFFIYLVQISNFCKANHISKNILFIIIDDLRLLTISEVYLPNIHKLAGNGVIFQNAFAQQALCAPSRNSILTGRRPDSLRLYDFYSYWRDSVANFSTLPQVFKESGYDTYSFGKIFHPGKSSNFSDDYPYSWSVLPYHAPSEIYKDSKVCNDNKTGKLQRNLICPINVTTQPGKTLPDLEILNNAINLFKERNATKPIFVAVGFHKPHIPLRFPSQYLEDVPIENVRPPSYPWKPQALPTVSWHPWLDVRRRDDIKRLNISFPYGIMPFEWTLRIKQSYYAASSYVDDLIGNLLANVDMRKTIVVLTSDHGWSLGENGLWAKYSNFDVALKVPLIFHVPGLNPKHVDSPVELIDIFPTLIELAGLKTSIPKCENSKKTQCFEGKSLMPYMRAKVDGDMKRTAFALSQYPRPSVQPQINSDKPRLKDIKIMGYSIRTKRYRYTEWIAFNSILFTKDWNTTLGIELYDHVLDPEESNNIHMKHKYKDIKSKLSKLLRVQNNR